MANRDEALLRPFSDLPSPSVLGAVGQVRKCECARAKLFQCLSGRLPSPQMCMCLRVRVFGRIRSESSQTRSKSTPSELNPCQLWRIRWVRSSIIVFLAFGDCPGCGYVESDASVAARQAVGLIKEVAQLDVGMTRGWGMQITRAWLDKCLGAYLLAMLVSTRGQPMQPWAMYQFGLNIIWTCQYNEVEFFNAFGVTTGQMAYVFGLVGQPYDATPQILGLQEPERAAVGAHAPAVDEVATLRDAPTPSGRVTICLKNGWCGFECHQKEFRQETAMTSPVLFSTARPKES